MEWMGRYKSVGPDICERINGFKFDLDAFEAHYIRWIYVMINLCEIEMREHEGMLYCLHNELEGTVQVNLRHRGVVDVVRCESHNGQVYNFNVGLNDLYTTYGIQVMEFLLHTRQGNHHSYIVDPPEMVLQLMYPTELELSIWAENAPRRL